MRGHISLTIYVAIFGLLLFAVNMIIVNLIGRNARKEVSKLQQEANSYKAKMFDLQEASKRESLEKNAPNTDDGASE